MPLAQRGITAVALRAARSVWAVSSARARLAHSSGYPLSAVLWCSHSYAERQRDYQMIAYLLAKEKEEDERDAAKRDKHKKEALKYREHLMAQMAKARARHSAVTLPSHAAGELRDRALRRALGPFGSVSGPTHAALRVRQECPGEGPRRCEREG